MIIEVSSDKDLLKEDPGILYIARFDLEGKELVKIGVTSRSIEERMSEILISIFKRYREFPYCRPKRFRKVEDAYEKEAGLHFHFQDYKYLPQKQFSGHTEFFDMPLDEAVLVYENLVNGDVTVESLYTRSPNS